MYDVVAHGAMIADRQRMDAYARALEARVTPGAVVADLGTGSGIFAMLACRSGAARVYAIEADDIIQVAREAAAANGFSDRIRFIQASSADVDLPERVDGVISDLRGALPLFGGGVAALIDARDRWLKSGTGWLIAERDTLWASLVASPTLHRRFAGNWDQTLGFDYSRARARSVNQYGSAEVKPEEILAPPQCWATLEYSTLDHPSVDGVVRWTLDRDVTAHGIAAWFDTETARGIALSNAPDAHPHVYRQVFFPWPDAAQLRAGDGVRIALRADVAGGEYVFCWSTDIDSPSGERRHAFRQSTFHGAGFSLEGLHRRADSYKPEPDDWAGVDRRVLELMPLRLSIGEIADTVAVEFPRLMKDRSAALTRVGRLSDRYSKRGPR